MLRHLRLVFGLAALAAVGFLADAAQATTSVRLEYLRNGFVYSAETISSSGASAQGSAAPAGTSQVRISVVAGAAIVTPGGANPTATQLNGARLQTCSNAAVYPLQAGDRVAIIEATDANACATGGGGGGVGATSTANAPTRTEGATGQAASEDLHGSTRVFNTDPSTGLPLDPNSPSNCGPTSTFVQCPTKAGQATLDADGSPIFPKATTADRVLTATNLTANTSTTVCPAQTSPPPVTTEIYFTTAGVGVGVNGQTLTAAAPGTSTTSSPDFAIGTAGTMYTFPVAPTNAVTAYGAAGVVRCIQTLRR